MTANERLILKCLWDAKGKAQLYLIGRLTGLSSDYVRFLVRSLEQAGYLKFANAHTCYLLTKGRNCFQETAKTAPDNGIIDTEITAEAQDVDLGNGEEKMTDSDEKIAGEENEKEAWKKESGVEKSASDQSQNKFLSFISKRIFNKCQKLKDFKARDKLISLPVWISKKYKNLTKKKS